MNQHQRDASWPVMPDSTPAPVPSRVERDRYHTALQQAHRAGRLDDGTFARRAQAIEAALDESELRAVVVDIPFDPAADQLARNRRITRRRWLSGVIGLGAVGVGAHAITRRWVDRAAVAPTPPPIGTTVPPLTSGAPTSAKPGERPTTVATALFQVPIMTKDMFPVMVAHAASVKVTEFHRVYHHSNTMISLVGRTTAGETVELFYQTGRETELRTASPETRFFPAKSIAQLDAADLLARSREVAELREPSLRISWVGEQWQIELSDGNASVSWDLTGRKRLRDQ